MIGVIDLGLKLDTLVATMDKYDRNMKVSDLKVYAETITKHADSLLGSLELFDVVAGQGLSFISQEELASLGGENKPDN